MRRCLPSLVPARRQRGISILVLMFLVLALGYLGVSNPTQVVAQQADDGYAPASGHAHVIAQGVIDLPEGDALWRVTRPRAPLAANAEFAERPLGFVLASDGPLLLVDEATGYQTRLGKGEAALVRAGTMQQRSSLGTRPNRYFSIEFLPVDAPPAPPDAMPLVPGIPFAAPSGLRDLDLLSDTLRGNETLAIPDSGSRNILLVTNGAVIVSRGDQVVSVLAGDVARFSGGVTVSVAPSNGPPRADDFAVFVVAMIGPELPVARPPR